MTDSNDYPYKASYRLILSIGFVGADHNDEEFYPPNEMSKEEWDNINDHEEFLLDQAKEAYEDCIEYGFKVETES